MIRSIVLLLTLTACTPSGDADEVPGDTTTRDTDTFEDPDDVLVLTDADGRRHYISYTRDLDPLDPATGPEDFEWSALTVETDGSIVARSGNIDGLGDGADGAVYYLLGTTRLTVGPEDDQCRMQGGTAYNACPILSETYLFCRWCAGCSPGKPDRSDAGPLTTTCY